MAKYKLLRSDKAQCDLRDILLFVAGRDGVDRAFDLLDDIERAVLRLTDMPYSGSLENFVYVNNPGYRFIVVKNYVVHYHVDEPNATVYIDHVKYGALSPQNQFS